MEQLIVGALDTNCWIFPLPGDSPLKECAVIDPGSDPEIIIARLEQLRLRPRYILLTHGHFDHIAALPDLAGIYGRTGPLDIGIHRDEAEKLGPEAQAVHRREFSIAAGDAAYVDSLWKPMPAATLLFDDGDTVGPFQVLHLPGHSRGSAGFFLEQEKIIFSGDTLFNGNVGRTDLPGGNWDKLIMSLGRLFALDGAVRVYPGHGPATVIGIERERLGSLL
jgi:glyoxylase-like metal-dependent hydrolase (beta-lactamase superfamily II)